MKTIYVLEVNCKIVSAYESEDAAIVAGLEEYTKWLSSYIGTEFSLQQIIEDLQSLTNYCHIKDYIYIYEIPLFSTGDDEE